MSVPHPLPEGAGALRRRGARDPRRGSRPVHRLPLPARAGRGDRVPVTGGRLVGIYVATAAGAPMEARDHIEAVAGTGLRDDRYATGTGTYSGAGRGARHVTLIEREAVDAVRREAAAIDVRE